MVCTVCGCGFRAPGWRPAPESRGATAPARAGWVVVRSASRSSFLFEHDLFGKPVSTFPDHALSAAHPHQGDRIELRLLGRVLRLALAHLVAFVQELDLFQVV